MSEAAEDKLSPILHAALLDELRAGSVIVLKVSMIPPVSEETIVQFQQVGGHSTPYLRWSHVWVFAAQLSRADQLEQLMKLQALVKIERMPTFFPTIEEKGKPAMDLTPEIQQLLHHLSQQLEPPCCSAAPGGNGGPVQPVSLTTLSPLPDMYYLQKSREHEVFYRLDLDRRSLRPELRVLIPTSDTILKFHMFLVTLTPAHPLSDLFARVEDYQGSQSFEEHREYALWQLLYAVTDTMKRLFWDWRASREQAGQEGALSEIDVRQVM